MSESDKNSKAIRKLNLQLAVCKGSVDGLIAEITGLNKCIRELRAELEVIQQLAKENLANISENLERESNE